MNQGDATNPELLDDLATISQQEAVLEAPPAQGMGGDHELAQFFAQSLDLLCVAGFDGYFKRLNPAWTTRLGWTLEELEARPFLDIVHPDDRVVTQLEVDALTQGEETILFKNRFRHRDGSYRWLRWNVRPLPGRGLIYAIARDITRQMRLESEIVSVVDREQERLGRELHDGLCQNLAGIAALSAALARGMAARADPATSAAAEIAKLLNDTISQTRDLARGLAPLDLHEAGLDVALEALAINIQHLFHVSCTLVCEDPVVLPRPGAEAHLFRIAQEAINNAVRHGRADHIVISLGSKHRKGLLSILDSGVGISEKSIKDEGIGLHTMAYRARQIGGSLEVRPRPQGGTAVTCVFPLPEAPGAGEDPDNARDHP